MKTSRVLSLTFLLSILVMLGLTSCTAGPNAFQNSTGANNVVAGFGRGLWHGFICLFTLIASLFSNSVGIYDVHNNGAWYNSGFVLGVAMFFGCGSHSKSAAKSHHRCEGRFPSPPVEP